MGAGGCSLSIIRKFGCAAITTPLEAQAPAHKLMIGTRRVQEVFQARRAAVHNDGRFSPG